MFKKGEMVVYPNHGIGVIEEIQDQNIDGESWNCYFLRIESSETKVMVPTDKADLVGLRKVVNKKETEQVFSLLKNGSFKMQSNWKGRFKENSDKMRTGSLYEVAVVLKGLTYLSRKKALSFREKRMLERAKFLLVSEIAEAESKPRGAVEEKVDKALEKTFGALKARPKQKPVAPRRTANA
jgi:CarD family transcriptional regulator